MNLVHECVLPPNEPDDRDERMEEREIAKDRETLADIVAEYRNDADAMDRGELYQPTTEYVRRLLDRIEEAWKRKKAEIEADALAVGGIVEAELHTPGNAAAMREALEKVAVSSEYALKHDDLDCGDLRGFIEEMGQDARAALSAPARNCDLYDNKTDAELGFFGETGEDDRNPLYWQLFANWLFAPAKTKGEGDGR